MVGPFADQHAAEWGEFLESGRDVDGVTHDGIREIARPAHFAYYGLPAVDPDSQTGPFRMVGSQRGHLVLEFKGRADCSRRVVGLVAAAVESSHDGVSDELLHFATE